MKNILCIITEDYVHNGRIEIGSLKQTVLSFVNRKVVILLEDQVAKIILQKLKIETIALYSFKLHPLD